ncbi:hypothetical protein KIPB_008719 [Kipferlia bialata]|uniref:V-SNARE coiled-coil homology domain-containing protein n=1 Tax=Kipferlia bialata TaxID=797122 RepID=A0A9K3D2R9_9EUKA|nr:hypothetical protein KIPB_008719 [Kipferlia bialata]|eukprot:g8719.t1
MSQVTSVFSYVAIFPVESSRSDIIEFSEGPSNARAKSAFRQRLYQDILPKSSVTQPIQEYLFGDTHFFLSRDSNAGYYYFIAVKDLHEKQYALEFLQILQERCAPALSTGYQKPPRDVSALIQESVKEARSNAENGVTAKLKTAHAHINTALDQMSQNVNQLLERGQKCTELVNEAEVLKANSQKFHTQSTGLKTQMCRKNAKMTIMLVLIVLLILFIIYMAFFAGN